MCSQGPCCFVDTPSHADERSTRSLADEKAAATSINLIPTNKNHTAIIPSRRRIHRPRHIVSIFQLQTSLALTVVRIKIQPQAPSSARKRKRSSSTRSRTLSRLNHMRFTSRWTPILPRPNRDRYQPPCFLHVSLRLRSPILHIAPHILTLPSLSGSLFALLMQFRDFEHSFVSSP